MNLGGKRLLGKLTIIVRMLITYAGTRRARFSSALGSTFSTEAELR